MRRRPAAGPRRRRVHFGRGGRAPVSGRPPVGSGRVPAVGGLRPAGVRAGPAAEARAERLRRRAAGWQETARADGPPVPCLARGGESIHPRFHVSVKALTRIPSPLPLCASLPLYALTQPAHLLQSPGSGVCRLSSARSACARTAYARTAYARNAYACSACARTGPYISPGGIPRAASP
jgi:hypothetical protein